MILYWKMGPVLLVGGRRELCVFLIGFGWTRYRFFPLLDFCLLREEEVGCMEVTNESSGSIENIVATLCVLVMVNLERKRLASMDPPVHLRSFIFRFHRNRQTCPKTSMSC